MTDIQVRETQVSKADERGEVWVMQVTVAGIRGLSVGGAGDSGTGESGRCGRSW